MAKPKDLTELKNLVSKFLKENQKTETRATYEKFFIDKKSEFLAKYDVYSVLEVYLDTYYECYFNSA
jgi:hypothetical protein